jgi:pyruvate kinase
MGVQHPDLHARLRPGNKILLDDGKLELLVKAGAADVSGVLCSVVVGGTLLPRKSVNTPGVDNGLDVLSEKDQKDLLFGKEMGLDWVAASFVRFASDVDRVRSYLMRIGWNAHIISKIETPFAIENLSEIVRASDGVMVARGDLGIECPIEEVPIYQREALALCATHSKLAIVATQMLESMMSSPRPTRAEASDVSNAVFEGTQVVMLSGETASGKYPVETVRTMHNILCISEAASEIKHGKPEMVDPDQQLFGGALKLQEITGGSCLVLGCRSAQIARFAASFHAKVPVVGLFNNEREAAKAALYYGVLPIIVDKDVKFYDLETLVRKKLADWKLAQVGDKVPWIFSQPRAAEKLNTIRWVTI